MGSRPASGSSTASFQQRAEAALSKLVDQGLVTGVRASLQDGRRRVEVSVSLYVTPAREAELCAIFKEATCLEIEFWQMGWRAGLAGE